MKSLLRGLKLRLPEPRTGRDGMKSLLKGFSMHKKIDRRGAMGNRMFRRTNVTHGKDFQIGRKFKHNTLASGDMGISPSMEELEKHLGHASSGSYGTGIRKKKKLFNFKSKF